MRAARSLSGLADGDIDEIVERTRRLHDALVDARIVVTGATGWFGTWLLDALVAIDRAAGLGIRVVAISRSPQRFATRHPLLHAAREIEWLRADVRDPTFAVDGPVSHVIHGATESSAKLNLEEPDRMFATIVDGTRNVLRIVAPHRDAKLLLISSGAVYGLPSPGSRRWSESDLHAPDQLDPANAYAEGKRAAEHLGALWHRRYGVHVAIARCFAFVGPHMPFDTHFAIGNFIRDALDGTIIRIAGDGTPRRSYLYMTDLVVWLLTILVEGRPIRPYNVGSDDAVSIARLAALCGDVAGRAVPVEIAARCGGHDYLPDIARARTELGLDVGVPLSDAIRRTVDWKQRQRTLAAA